MKNEAQSGMVSDHMTVSPFTVARDDSLEKAMDLMGEGKVRELPVIEHGKLVGIVTDRDLRAAAPPFPMFREQEEIRCYLQSIKVANAMTAAPVVVGPKTRLVEAAKLLHTHRIGSLPVVADGNLVGIVSLSDILKLFIEQHTRGPCERAKK